MKKTLFLSQIEKSSNTKEKNGDGWRWKKGIFLFIRVKPTLDVDTIKHVGIEKSRHDALTCCHSETGPTFFHVSERWIAEAVRAERVALATGPRRPQHQLKVIEGTAELLVQFDGSVLGKTVRLITVGAVEPAGFSLRIHFSVKHFSNFNDKKGLH